jgi:hypothetical protein
MSKDMHATDVWYSLAQVFTLTMPPGEDYECQAANFARSISASAKQTYSIAGTVKYEIPCEEVELADVFIKVDEARSTGLQVLDWGIHNATLEDVFVSLATNIAEPMALN